MSPARQPTPSCTTARCGAGCSSLRPRRAWGTRHCIEVNGLPSVELKYHYPGLKESAAGLALLAKIREQELATLAASDAIVCPSAVTRAFLISLGVDARRITVIPNGVSLRDFAPTPWPVRGDEPPVLLYIGTLADWQGLTVLIDAVAQVIQVRPVRLRIVGRGRSRQRKQLAKQIRKAGLEPYVSVEAAVPHHLVPGLIAQADLCVAPLAYNDRNVTQGCCPIKVIEYMAAGRALVAANLPVVRELVREDVDGLLFIPDDPADLARQVLRLLEDRAPGLPPGRQRRRPSRGAIHLACRTEEVAEGVRGIAGAASRFSIAFVELGLIQVGGRTLQRIQTGTDIACRPTVSRGTALMASPIRSGLNPL